MEIPLSPYASGQPIGLVWDDEPDATEHQQSAPQCEQCRKAAQEHAEIAENFRRAGNSHHPLSRYQHQFGPMPTWALKYYWITKSTLDAACLDALQTGAPIRDWSNFIAPCVTPDNWDWGDPVAESSCPANPTLDVHVRYQRRFGEVPPRRLRIAPPLDQPDAFDLGMEAAIASGRPVEDWQALIAPVRRVSPPTCCWLHGEPLRPGYGRISRIANIGQSVTQRHTPFANLGRGDAVDRDIDEAPEYPVAYCQTCRDDVADWLKFPARV